MFFFQILLGLTIILFEVKRKRAGIIDLMLFCSVIYFICYVVAPISGFFMLPNFSDYSVMRYTYKGIRYGEDSFFLTGGFIYLSYLIFITFYSVSRRSSNFSFFNKIMGNRVSVRVMLKMGIIFFSLAMIFLLFESLKAGGFFKWMISNPRLYHVNDADSVNNNSWLSDKFIKLIILASYIFWGVIKHYKVNAIKYKKNYLYILFFLSILFSVAVLIHTGGRFLLFQYLATFLIANLIVNNKKIRLVPIATITLIGGVVLLYGRTFFKLFIYDDALALIKEEDKNFLDYYYGVINNYTFPFYSFNNNVNWMYSEYYAFLDFVLWPFNFLPSSYRFDVMVDSTAINTYRLMGVHDRFIPTDIHSYGYINLGFFGVLLVSSFFGLIVKKINFNIHKNPVSVILYVCLCFLIGFRIMYFDPYHFFKGSFEIILMFMIIVFLSNKK